MIRIVSSGLPLALYPCATSESCYAYDGHNTFYWLDDLRWIADMDPRLRRYLGYSLGRSSRPDFLRALDADLPASVMKTVYSLRHSVWETAAWLEVSGRSLVRRADGTHRIVTKVEPGDEVIRGEQLPCTTTTNHSGLYSFSLSRSETGTTIFCRDDPMTYERAMNEALPALYQSFHPSQPSS